MCGIVGYIGKQEAYPILIRGLQRLEYRGYDSAGIALIHNENLNVYKAKGKVADLVRFAEQQDIHGTIGIAHTRWATHGEPNQVKRRIERTRLYFQQRYRYRSVDSID